MKAIILAGGFGTRLRTVVSDVPKPMAPIQGKPFLAYILAELKAQGFTQIVLSVFHMRELIQNYFQSNYLGMHIDYAIEDKPLGTGGAIAYALQKMADNEPVFVLNGDTFLQLNYQQMQRQHRESGVDLTLAVREMSDCERYGKAVIQHDIITGFKEKGEAGVGYINGGIYLLNAHIFDMYALPSSFSFENDFLVPNLEMLKPSAYYTNGYFIDIGVPEDYVRACADLPRLELVT